MKICKSRGMKKLIFASLEQAPELSLAGIVGESKLHGFLLRRATARVYQSGNRANLKGNFQSGNRANLKGDFGNQACGS